MAGGTTTNKSIKAAQNLAETRRQRQKKLMITVFKYAGGVLLALLFASVFYRGTQGGVKALEVFELKDVVFGGDPWIVQCIDDNTPVHNIAVQTAFNLKGHLRVGSFYCHDQLPSGKNFFERFKLKENPLVASSPTMFLFGNGNRPTRIDVSKMANMTKLEDYLLKAAVPKVHPITTEKKLKTHCTNIGKECVLLFWEGDKLVDEYPWLERSMQRHRLVHFVHVIPSQVQLSFEKQLPASEGPHPRVAFLKNDRDAIRAKAFKAKAHREDFTEESLNSFVDAAVSGSLELSVLPKRPTIKSITTKPKPRKSRSQEKPKKKAQSKPSSSEQEREARRRSNMERETEEYEQSFQQDDADDEENGADEDEDEDVEVIEVD